MKISQEYLESLKNMNLETFKNFVKKDDITEEKMIDVELTQDDVQNIINAYDKDIKKMKKQEKEINRLNKLLDETRLSELHKEYIINELEKYIHNELVLDFYNDDMPCELIINKMEKMIKELKEE